MENRFNDHANDIFCDAKLVAKAEYGLTDVPINVCSVLYSHMTSAKAEYEGSKKMLKLNKETLDDLTRSEPNTFKGKRALTMLGPSAAHAYAKNMYRLAEREVKNNKIKYKVAKSIYDNHLYRLAINKDILECMMPHEDSDDKTSEEDSTTSSAT